MTLLLTLLVMTASLGRKMRRLIYQAGSLGLGGVTSPHHVLCISGKAHASSGFSIGPCTCINTTPVVNGSMAAKTRCVSATGCLATTDYGIFASGTITVTLPPAKTQKGMMLFVKNTSTSTVTIKPGGTDTIEGKASCSPRTLGKQYDSLTLISNGSSEWFIQSGVKCGSVIS